MGHLRAVIGLLALAGALLCVWYRWQAPNRWLLHPSRRNRLLVQACVFALLYVLFFPPTLVAVGSLLERWNVQAGTASNVVLILSSLSLAALAFAAVIRLAVRKQRRLDAERERWPRE